MAASINHQIACDYLSRLESLTYNDLADALTYKWFRLNTLYHIKDKDGKKILFKPNREQEEFYLNIHGRDLILKARQLGFTTFKMIYSLDDCLFIRDHSAGCICHNLEDAKDIFRNKIKFAYQNITDDQIKLFKELGYDLPLPVNDKDNGYVFDNGSNIKVSTSYRGGTLQDLHISEFGKICKKYPEKAKEIVTGALEAVGVEGNVTIESTAEGREGYFYDYAEEARKSQLLGKTLTKLDYNFHFFSWIGRDEYSIEGDWPESLNSYFNQLEAKLGIKISDGQKAWYAGKWKTLGDDIKREYPATPEEAFEVSVTGAYYARQFTDIYKQGRIIDLGEYGNDGAVNTVCDIGIGDSTAIWFYRKVGGEYHILHYHENSGEPLGYYIKYIQDTIIKNKWVSGSNYAPHDMNNREFASQGKTRRELALQGVEYNDTAYKMNFKIVDKLGIDDGIQIVRGILPKCVFDSKGCEQGIKSLESYRKEWNDKLSCWRDRPLHDWASHGADAFRYFAVQEEGRRKPVQGVAWG